MTRPLTIVNPPDTARTVNTHCPYCAFQCGISITTSPTGTTLAGDPAFPVNNGQLCIKGFTALDMLHRADRVTTPMKRTASGEFEPVSWDAALDDIAARLDATRTRHGRDANACYGSGSLTNEKAYLLGKFARVALKTANIDYNGRYCMSSAAAAQNKAFGIDRGMPFPIADIPAARTVVLWGSNLADTLPPAMQYFDALKQSGGQLVVVDPRRTETARVADVHLQLTPGTDLALANGMLHIVIEERLFDEHYVATRTTGFDQVRAVVSQYHPAHVERLTGVSELAMRRLVRRLADGASMLLSGRGPEQQSKGVDSVLAMINLMLALGHCGKPHAGFGTLTGQGNGQGGREHGQKCDQLPGYRLIENESHRRAVAAVWNVPADSLPRKGKHTIELIQALGDDVKSLIVMGSNLAVASPDLNETTRRLDSLDLLVVCDAFMNETATRADYVLPITLWAEEDGTMTNFEGRVLRRRRAVDPPGTARSDLWILSALASRLGAEGFTFDTADAVFEELSRCTAGGVADYSGIAIKALDQANGVHWPCTSSTPAEGTPRLFADRFAHPDGRARFHPVEHRDAGELPDDEYPLYFLTGRLKHHYNSGAQTRGVGPLIEQHPLPRLQIHPRLASRFGIADGQTITLESRRGRATFVAWISPDIRPDSVFAPFHWGGDRAANRLTQSVVDPTSRMPEFKLCAARFVFDTSSETDDA
jgi:assimilatory nitrate reductase catalytic subunit